MGKIVKLKNANNAYTYPITKTEAVYIEDNKTTLKDYLDATAIIKTVGPAQMVTFNDGANNIPVKSCIINLEPYQEGSGDPSPDNIRPISGRTGMTVKSSGKNLLENTISTHTEAGITFTKNADGTVTANGTTTALAQARIMIGADDLPRGVNLYFSGCPMGGAARIYDVYVWDSTTNSRAKQWDGVTNVVSDYGTSQNNQLKLEEGHQYIYIIRLEQVGLTANNLVFKPMIRVADSLDSEYEPYTGTEIPITWESIAGTVYGGALDVTNGILTVDRAFITLNGTQTIARSNWQPKENSVGWLYPWSLTQSTIPISSTEIPIVISNRVKTVSYSAIFNGTENNCISLVYDTSKTYGLVVRYADTSLTTETAINTFLTQNPIQICYPLATPLSYTLIPTGICTLLGVNNMWSDIKNIKVSYKADLAKYIANAISSN